MQSLGKNVSLKKKNPKLEDFAAFFLVHLQCILDYAMTDVQLNLFNSVLQFSL